MKKILNTDVVARLPMRPHLLKYVHWVHGGDGVVDITDYTGLVPQTLQLLVQGKSTWLAEAPHVLPPSFSEDLLVKMNPYRVDRGEIFFTASAVRLFDRYANTYFHHWIRTLVEQGIKYGALEKDIINEALHGLGITEEDIGYDSVRRKANLYRKARGEETLRKAKAEIRLTHKSK